MKIFRIIVVLIKLSVIICTSCASSPSEGDIQTTISSNQSAQSTNTDELTNTTIPTATRVSITEIFIEGEMIPPKDLGLQDRIIKRTKADKTIRLPPLLKSICGVVTVGNATSRHKIIVGDAFWIPPPQKVYIFNWCGIINVLLVCCTNYREFENEYYHLS